MPKKPFLSQIALSFLAQSYDSVVITTAQLEGDHPRILYVNRTFCEMTGYGREEDCVRASKVTRQNHRMYASIFPHPDGNGARDFWDRG